MKALFWIRIQRFKERELWKQKIKKLITANIESSYLQLIINQLVTWVYVYRGKKQIHSTKVCSVGYNVYLPLYHLIISAYILIKYKMELVHLHVYSIYSIIYYMYMYTNKLGKWEMAQGLRVLAVLPENLSSLHPSWATHLCLYFKLQKIWCSFLVSVKNHTYYIYSFSLYPLSPMHKYINK